MARHVLVTGAGGALGRAVVEAFLREGAAITALDARADALDLIAKGAPDRVRTLIADLADLDADELVDTAIGGHGPIDVLVNAAGIWPATPLLEMTGPMWDHVMAVNTRAPVLLTVSIARRAVAAGRSASVVNIASGAAIRARPGAAHYATSKAALEMATKACAVELGGRGVRVNCVSPGFVSGSSQEVNPITDEYARAVSGNPLGRVGDPEDVANAVLYLSSPQAAWVTGSVLRVDGGSSAGSADIPVHWNETSPLQQPN